MPVDNTLPYRTGQVAFFKQGDQLRDRFSTGWWISDRTPLVGLDFAFSVGALGVHMRSENPSLRQDRSTRMQVRDPYAYWLYNLVSVLMASAVVLGVFLFARIWKKDNRRLAVAAAIVTGLAPGLFLNAIYAWPKEAVAYFVLAAAGLALQRRPVAAGGFLALAYLTHPVGILFLPSVAVSSLPIRACARAGVRRSRATSSPRPRWRHRGSCSRRSTCTRSRSWRSGRSARSPKTAPISGKP
jgi:hypothetical protein